MKRMMFFRDLIAPLKKPLKVLDVGGEKDFWNRLGFGNDAALDLTIINTSDYHLASQDPRHIHGDARDLSRFKDKEFDIVFSNSVIEHVGELEDQKKMAREVQRVGKHYFVQTPNYYFPMEPHFLFPGYQFLPLAIRVWLLRHYDLGFMKRTKDKTQALSVVKSVKLLKQKQLQELFPKASLKKEKFLGLTKSYICYGGF